MDKREAFVLDSNNLQQFAREEMLEISIKG